MQQGERHLGAVEGLWALGGSGWGCCCPQMTGIVHGRGGQSPVQPKGVVAVGDHGAADMEAFLPVGLQHV